MDNIETVFITITMASGAGGIGLLSTVVAIPVVIALEASALLTGLLSVDAVRSSRSKGEKHQKIKMIADSKLNTISTHISKALIDNHISDDEFKLIMEELEKYKTMKNEIRTKIKKKITAENEESLIERGRQEARESFRRLVEKNSESTKV